MMPYLQETLEKIIQTQLKPMWMCADMKRQAVTNGIKQKLTNGDSYTQLHMSRNRTYENLHGYDFIASTQIHKVNGYCAPKMIQTANQ